MRADLDGCLKLPLMVRNLARKDGVNPLQSLIWVLATAGRQLQRVVRWYER